MVHIEHKTEALAEDNFQPRVTVTAYSDKRESSKISVTLNAERMQDIKAMFGVSIGDDLIAGMEKYITAIDDFETMMEHYRDGETKEMEDIICKYNDKYERSTEA